MPRKTVLVTGASRGIGKAVAIKFAKKGYNVVISCVHRAEQLEQTRREIESFQAPCLAYLGDMGDLKSCETLFSQIRSRFGGVDVLVNNAGILPRTFAGHVLRGLGADAPRQPDLGL